MLRFLQGVTIAVFVFFSTSLYSQCVEGDCVNGEGKYVCDCGYTYVGEFKNGEKVQGTLTKKDMVYVGAFKNDVAHGYGELYYKDGSWYKGEFENNQFSGQGEIHFKDGTWYVGSFLNDEMDGYGVYHYKKDRVYIGEIINSNFIGLGVKIITGKGGNAVSYKIGEFENNLLNGVGAILEPGGGFDFGEVWKGDIDGFYCYANEMDSLSEFYPFLSEAEYNKLQQDTFSVASVSYDSVAYNLTGYRKSIQLLLAIKKEGHTVNYYTDKKRGIFFVSNENTPLIGKAINLKGEIYAASLSTSPVLNIQLNEKLLAP